MIEKVFLEFITQGLYKKATELLIHLNEGQYRDFIMKRGFEKPSIALYSYICFILYNNETAEKHFFTARLLAHPLCVLEGAYSSALFHMRRAIELDPENSEYKSEILFFYGTPDDVMSAEEASAIAYELLCNNPNDESALEVLKKIEWSKKRKS